MIRQPHTDGARALAELVQHIGHISGATCDPDQPDDLRDYGAMTAALERTLAQHRAAPDFLHALAVLLCCVADGCMPSAFPEHTGA